MNLNEALVRATMDNQEYGRYMLQMSIRVSRERIWQIRDRIRTEEGKLKQLESVKEPGLLTQQQIMNCQNLLKGLRMKYQRETVYIADLKRRQAMANR